MTLCREVHLTTTATSATRSKDQKAATSSTPPSAKAGPESRQAADGKAWFSKVSDYLGVYLVYVFISGWSFGEFYLRELGVSPRWFELSLSNVLVNGFTVLLFSGGKWLLPFYLLVLLIPIVVELPSWNNHASIRILGVFVLVSLLWPIFLISKTTGLNQAKIDKTPELSRLQVMTFSPKNGKRYSGRLVCLRNGLYFIREVRDLNSMDTEDPSATLQVSIYRVEDLQDVRIAGAP